MAQNDFDNLAEKIDKLIAQHQHLHLENQTLKDTQRILNTEHEVLLQKHTIAKRIGDNTHCITKKYTNKIQKFFWDFQPPEDSESTR